MINNRKNITWVDYTKIFACVLVVLGHLVKSFEGAGYLSGSSLYYCVPIRTIYCFHVQLFFVCSGYLYQRFKKDISLKGHFRNVGNKAIALGVPYFIFSGITLIMKNAFSGKVNSEATPVLKTLFIKPMAPYWYLYVLFFLFLIIPCVKDSKKLYLIFALSVIIKILYVLSPFGWPYIILQIASQSIWFTFGMVLTTIKWNSNIFEKILCIVLGIAGFFMAFVVFRNNSGTKISRFLISILLVSFFVYLFAWISKDREGRVSSRFRKYILPIFLMHTIFAAGVRIILTKAGINLFSVQAILGIVASFVFPMLVYKFIKNKWYLLVFVEPLKAWKMKKSLK